MNLKKCLKILTNLICSYILLFFFYNLNIIFRRIMFSCSDKIIFISKTLIISMIIINIILYFKDILFRKKRYLFIILFFLTVCNFAEGYYSDFKSYTFIILYLYLLFMTFYIMLKRKMKFELSIVYSFSFLIVSAFVVGMFGMLSIYKYLMLLFFLYFLYDIYKQYKHNKQHITKLFEDFFDSSFIIFNILWSLSILFGAGLYVHVYDEYSHWAYDAKAMIYYSKFGTSQDIMLKTRAYAPIFTVWHYIVSIFGGFSEHNLYVGLNMLISVYLIPTFYYIKHNSKIVKILGVISLIYCCYIFGGVYSYTTLYVDYAITSIFASSIVIYYISKEEKLNLDRLLVLLFIILTLSKTNGFVIGLILLMIVGINELLDDESFSIKKCFKKIFFLIKKYKKFILAVLLTFLVWKVYLFITGKITTDYYDFTLLPTGLKGDLKYKLNYDFVNDFFRKVLSSFDKGCFGGLIPLSLYQYIIVSFVFMYILFYKLTNDVKLALRKIIPFIISYVVFLVITVLSMFVAMSLYEASMLASFDRYLNWYNVAILIFELVLILKIQDEKNHVFKTIFLTYIVLSISFTTIISFAINPSKAESYNVSVQRSEKVAILNENTPEDALIYVIDQKDTEGIMAMWYTRYYAFPRKNNATSSAINWKIKTKANKDDLSDWGLTAKKWEKHLKEFNFDYVFLYSADDLFFEKTKYMYEDYDEAKKSILFKIEYDDDDNIRLIAVK